MRDSRVIGQLETRLRRLKGAGTSIERARVAAELRDMADQLVAKSIREANKAGETWRQIGADLGVPYQTLYRRYGGDQGS
jgi:hypothetical protein